MLKMTEKRSFSIFITFFALFCWRILVIILLENISYYKNFGDKQNQRILKMVQE